MQSKMIHTSILRYITSDRQHLAAENENENSILLRLPYDIRKRIYEFAGLSEGLIINLNYEYPVWLDERVRSYDSWNELIPPHAREHERQEVSTDDEKVSDYENKVESSESSQLISQILDSPLPDPGAGLSRIRPRCGRLHCGNPWWYCDPCNRLLPSQLLDVCRAVSNEVKYLFYSKNHFNITSSGLGRFSGLVVLRPEVLSWLSSLSISVSICTCTTDPTDSRLKYCLIHDAGKDRSKDLGIPGQEKLLQHAAVRYKFRGISEWKLLCRHLTLYITPHQLKLWVRVNAMILDIEPAKDFIMAMMQLPVLRECGIYFTDDSYLDEFQELSRYTAVKLTGRLSDALNSPFRLLDLPREIQLKILRFTDLVINKDIAWCPYSVDGAPRVFDASNLVWDNWDTETDFYPYECKCCEKCSDTADTCFCPSKAAAFSTSCTCWRMPIPLFLVSRQMREDAIHIFFSLNNFLILPATFLPREMQSLEILEFFSKIAGPGRRHLRSVTWMLPAIVHEWGPKERREWREVVDICARELSIERLVFTIDMLYHARRRRARGWTYERDLEFNGWITKNLEDWEWRAGLFMVESMARHKDWKNVHVHLSWPWYDTVDFDDLQYPENCSSEVRELREQREALLEQRVMGPDNVADGKYDRRHKWNGYYCICEECVLL